MKNALIRTFVLAGALFLAVAQSGEGGGPAIPGYLKLPKQVVNLSGERRPHFMQVIAQAYVETAECSEAIEANSAVLTNETIMMLSGKPYKEALSVETREAWRQELMQRLQEKLKALAGEDCISELVFSDLIVQ